jgi:hypothetical protein
VSKKIQTGSSEGSSSSRILQGRRGKLGKPGATAGRHALDSLLYFVQASLRIPQSLAESRSQIADDLLDLAPDLVVDALLLLLLLRRFRDRETKKLGWTRGEDVAAFLVGLKGDFVSPLRARRAVSFDKLITAANRSAHLLDCLAQDGRQIEEELGTLEDAKRALQPFCFCPRFDDGLENGLSARRGGCTGTN